MPGGLGKHGRDKIKCEKYRTRVGRPRGPGVVGNKAGKGKVVG